ncbi:hypothetical protein [Methylobacterium variabile]|nr:hypothetical protein [Methylobacterium variabile]
MKKLDMKTLGTVAGGTICAPACPPCPSAPVCPPPPPCAPAKSKKC